MSSALRIGVSQIPNTTDVGVNLATILECLSTQKSLGAEVVVFPECAMSGFSADVRNADFSAIHTAIESVQIKARELGISVVIPTALRAFDGRFLNSGFAFLAEGSSHQFFKEGLTESETGFFAKGSPGTRVLEVNGFRLGLIVCAEGALAPWRYFESRRPPDVVLWPGYWGWDSDLAWNRERLTGLGLSVHGNMTEWKRPLIQANFSANSGDDTRSGPSGKSVVVDPTNELVFTGFAGERDDFVVEITKSVSGVAITGFRRAKSASRTFEAVI